MDNTELLDLYVKGEWNTICNKSNLKHLLYSDNSTKIIDFLKYVIEKLKVDLELVIKFENEYLDGLTFLIFSSSLKDRCHFRQNQTRKANATLLWHACRFLSINFVKYLVEKGADVNTSKESLFQSTPLMVSCNKNNLELIKFLVEDAKANVNQLDAFGDSCLFYLIRDNRDCLETVKYLVSKGANINIKNKFGRTPLHLSVESYSVEVLKYLCENGAVSYTDNSNESPLMTAALIGNESKFKYLLNNLKNLTPRDKVNALEIMGAILCERAEDIEKTYQYWEASINERGHDSSLAKKDLKTYDDFLKEFQTIEDLTCINHHPVEYLLQSLWIRERVLCNYFHVKSGEFELFKLRNLSKSLLNMYPQMNQIRLNDDNFGAYKMLTKLWLYSFNLQVQYLDPLHNNIVEGLCNWIEYAKVIVLQNIFLIDRDYTNYFSFTLKQLFKICIYELNRTILVSPPDELIFLVDPQMIDIINKSKSKIDLKKLFHDIFDPNIFKFYDLKIDFFDHNQVFKNQGFLLRSLLVLISVMIYSIDAGYLTRDEFDNEIKPHIKRFIRFKFKICRDLSSMFELLKIFHLNSSPELNSKFLNTKYLIEVLVESGIDPNEPDNYRDLNCALNHFLFLDGVYFNQREKVESLILSLLKNGAHFDYTNRMNMTLETAYEKKYHEKINKIVNPMEYLSLKCFCARALKKNKIPYENALHEDLVRFVNRH